MEILRQFSLKSLNTFGIDAIAAAFADAGTVQELKEILQDGPAQSRKILFLGGGSNILFLGDFSGLVVKISLRGMEVVFEDDDRVHLKVAAGEDWDGLVEYCAERNWAGLENLSGIPGQVGSSPIQNIGAYGTELKDHFVALEALNNCNGEIVHYDREQCQFGYRDSIFKRALKGRMVILNVTLEVHKHPVFNLSYQALKNHFTGIPAEELSVKTVRDAILAIRASKLPDPKVIGNAGSFFKNPVVPRGKLGQLKARFPGIVYFDSPGEQPAANRRQDYGAMDELHAVKLAAGWLIEQCGWKGFREGDAGVHQDQALVLVNYGMATGMEIMALSEKIRRSVLEKFGVTLEREVNII